MIFIINVYFRSVYLSNLERKRVTLDLESRLDSIDNSLKKQITQTSHSAISRKASIVPAVRRKHSIFKYSGIDQSDDYDETDTLQITPFVNTGFSDQTLGENMTQPKSALKPSKNSETVDVSNLRSSVQLSFKKSGAQESDSKKKRQNTVTFN